MQAPIAGTISARDAAVGAPASATGQPLFRIATGGEMELLAETPIKTLAKLAPNQPAKVEIVGIGALNGKVRNVSTTINPTTQLGEVRLFIGRDARLRVGAFGRAKIEIARRCGASVPFSAIFCTVRPAPSCRRSAMAVSKLDRSLLVCSQQNRRKSAKESPKAKWSFRAQERLCEMETASERLQLLPRNSPLLATGALASPTIRV